MTALKTLVVVMGILIVLGIGVLGYGMYQKASDPGFKFLAGDTAAPPARLPARLPAPMTAFGDLAVPLPEGCEVVEMTPHRRFLYLRAGPGRACTRIIVVDVRDGKVLGTISVAP